MSRKEEVRSLLSMSADDVIRKAGERLIVCENLDALHRRFAEDIASEIRGAQNGEPLRLILPVGPTGQYPYLTEILNRDGLSLSNCRIFFMDEYADEEGRAVGTDHPLSLAGTARGLFLSQLRNPPPQENVMFPGEKNIDTLAGAIEDAGGTDTCYGGIGIHGHIAFNEPGPGVKETGPRMIRINDYTVTINAVRARVGGNLEGFPRLAFTLGMREILGSGKIRLYCRNGCAFDWANTVLRLALFGIPGDDYPVTHIRDRDYTIVTDRETLAPPEIVL